VQRLAPTLAMTALLGCGPAALDASGGTTDTLTLGGAATRQVETLTDLEEVRDVAQLGDVVYVATDAGLLRYSSPDAPPEVVQGLPSEDIRGLAEDTERLWVATAGGLVHITPGVEGHQPVEEVPDIGIIMGFEEIEATGMLYLCGLEGLVRRPRGGEWEAFGVDASPVSCTTLNAHSDGHLWVGTTNGLLQIEGDVIREHAVGQGLPSGYVQAVVPMPTGDDDGLALVHGETASTLAYFSQDRWFGYTIPGLGEPVVGLIRHGEEVLLVTRDRVLALRADGDTGVPLLAIHGEIATVRSYRGVSTSFRDHRPGPSVGRDVLREPKALETGDVTATRPQAPRFTATPFALPLHGRLYHAFAHGAEGYVAVNNAGVIRIRQVEDPEVYRSRSLVPEGNLQIATDPRGEVWVLSRDRRLARFQAGRLVQVRLPGSLVGHALASGREGAYLAALDPASPNVLRVFLRTGRSWGPLLERSIEVPTELTGVPFMAVAPDGTLWVALQIRHEAGEDAGNRTFGLVAIDTTLDQTTYYHRNANREEGGLPIPDEVFAIDYDTEGNAYVATFSGMVRIGNGQAVVFGEARGVRGEIVNDLVTGDNRIWLAAGEGIGWYDPAGTTDRERFRFNVPENVAAVRPVAVAQDVEGHLWVASNRGLVLHEGEEWMLIGEEAGMPAVELTDVEVDAAGRVWVLAEDRLMLLER
jgi:hypothetical protein